jgi:hypothetical protein
MNIQNAFALGGLYIPSIVVEIMGAGDYPEC